MKVYWIRNLDCEVYGNARYFSETAVPKLYCTRDRAQRLIDEARAFQTRRDSSPVWYGLADAYVVEGELTSG